jgi:hypothetical protein
VRHDRRAIARLRTAADYNVKHSAAPHSSGLLSARTAVALLHAQDNASQQVRPSASGTAIVFCLMFLQIAAGEARMHVLQLDEAANR